MSYDTSFLLVDGNGRPIPQFYDVDTDSFKPLTELQLVQLVAGDEKIGSVELSGSIPEYAWLDDDEVIPENEDKLAMGVSINTSTNEMIVKYWNKTKWVNLVE